MPDQKLTQLPALIALSPDDLFYVVDTPGGPATSCKMSASVLDSRYLQTANNLTDLTNVVVARASLGLGSLAVINSPLPIVNGGSGQVTQQAAINALTNVAAATNEYVLTKDTGTGNAIYKAVTVLPVVDETAIVYETGTPANTLTFDVSAFTTARVVTWPDAAMTVAGLEVANVFTAAQTIDGSANAIQLTVQASAAQVVNLLEFQASDAISRGDFSISSGFTLRPSSSTAPVSNATGKSSLPLEFENWVWTGAAAEKKSYTITASPVSGSNDRSELLFAHESVIIFYLGYSAGTYTAGFQNVSTFSLPATTYFSSLYATAGAGIGLRSFGAGDWYCYTQGAQNLHLNANGLNTDDIKILASNHYTGIGGTPIVRLHAIENDAVTGAITTIARLTHNSTGTPAAGFGSALVFGGESSTTADQDMARFASLWNVATHASRVADLVAYASYSGGESEIWRGRAGAAPLFGVLGATPVVRQAHIADPSGGGTQDAEARTAINAILVVLENFGFVATS